MVRPRLRPAATPFSFDIVERGDTPITLGSLEAEGFPGSTPADSGRRVAGVGLSPDGTAIIMIIADVTNLVGHQLAVAPILDDGTVGPLGVIATGEQLAPNNGDKTIRPHGLGEQTEVVRSRDKIVFGLGPNQVVTLDLGS